MSYPPDFSGYQITFVDKCDSYTDVRLSEVFPENICLILLHTMVPYYFTYHHGGTFQWTQIKDQVDVQCPNRQGQVRAVILQGNTISTRICGIDGSCAAGHSPGDIFHLTEIFRKICPLVFDSIFSWIQLEIDTSVLLKCPGCEGKEGKIFRVGR